MKNSAIMQKQELLQERLDLWLASSPIQSMWLTAGPIRVYMRKSPLPLADGTLVPALTLANIGVKEKSQGRGSFTSVIDWMLRQDVRILKVENVMSLIVYDAMVRRGWIGDDGTPASFKKVL